MKSKKICSELDKRDKARYKQMDKEYQEHRIHRAISEASPREKAQMTREVFTMAKKKD